MQMTSPSGLSQMYRHLLNSTIEKPMQGFLLFYRLGKDSVVNKKIHDVSVIQCDQNGPTS